MNPPRPSSPSRPPRSPRAFDPRALDVAAFCRAGGELEGELTLAALPRLASSLLAEADGPPAGPVAWRARGVLRPVTIGAPQFWIDIAGRAEVRLQCQRCLQPMSLVLEVDRPIRFVDGEDEAARLDEEGEEDVLALTHRLDLRALLEDELILSLPLVPRHDSCPQPLPVPLGDPGAAAGPSPAAPEGDRPHPFAALARLRKGQ